MTGMDRRIEDLLITLKADERSSPAGAHWQKFWEFLGESATPDDKSPPVPLILAASGASDDTKHKRLGAQLAWAEKAGCLAQAIEALTAIPPENWNHGSSVQWNQDSYY